MKTRNGGLISLFVYSLLVLVLCTSIAHGQVTSRTNRRQVAPPLNPVSHHITGRLEKLATCNGRTGLRLQLVEYWLTTNSNDDGNLSRPSGTLFTRSGELQQGRLLGEVALENRITDFDIQWPEVASFPRVPWIQAEDSPSHSVTAYRVLSLRVVSDTANLFFTLTPKPIITFFGNETRKNIRVVKLHCFFAT